MNTKKKIIDYFRANGNEPASYLDLMRHVTVGPSLARAVQAMLKSGEMEEVPGENEVLVRLK